MGNAPSSPRGSTPPSSPYPPPRVPPRVHSPPPRDALALMRGQSLTSMATPVAATTHSSHTPPSAMPQNIESPTTKQGRPVQGQTAEQDVGEAMPGELEESPQENTQRTDWSAARVAMERAIGTLRHRAEELARDTLERRREQRAIEEEEARALHERKMTIYEDAEPGPLEELRYPPGLERRAGENEASALSPSHSSAPTTETLVEEPEQESEKPEVVKLSEMVTEKQVTDAVQDAADDAVAAPGEPEIVKETAALPEVQVAGPEHSQVSGEEGVEDISKNDEEAEALPQEAISIVQETLVVTEEQHPLDQEYVVSPHRLSTVPEEASDTQSERLSSSIEFPRPNTPHPTIDDNRSALPVPFPVTGEHEDQGYGTQEDEDRTTKTSPRVQGKHVHWGSVEAQPAYASAHDEEDHVEEHSPPFSRLLLPPPPPPPPAVLPPVPVAEPQREARAERATRLPVRRTVPPLAAVQKSARKFEPGNYTATDVRWGMALDLSSADNRSLIAFGLHGWENQQWDFNPCGAGFIIKSVSNGSFLTVEGLVGLHTESNAEIVTGAFPLCWEMEVMDNGSAEEDESVDVGDVYTRIRLPRTEMFIGLRGGYAGAQLFLTKDVPNTSTYWRLRAPRREQVVKNPPISTTESIRNGGMTTLITTTSVTTTTTRTMTRIVTGDA